MNMKDRLIERIKDCRAEADRLWQANNANSCGRAAVYEIWADDLETWVQQLEKENPDLKTNRG